MLFLIIVDKLAKKKDNLSKVTTNQIKFFKNTFLLILKFAQKY